MSNIVYGHFGLKRYEDKISKMCKLELLDEMVGHQEERAMTNKPTREMLERGFVLFQALLNCAETIEFKAICEKYLQKIYNELEDMKEGK
jgi:hypothetical protein